MCDTCATHILGPGEVAGKVARSKTGRKVGVVLFYVFVWTVLAPMIPFIFWGWFGWWCVPMALAVLALGIGGVRLSHKSARLTVVQPLTQAQRLAELERRRRNAIPGIGRAAQPALPRAMRRSLTRPRRALPAPVRALEPTRVITPAVPVKRR
jgi:hypothetical protein